MRSNICLRIYSSSPLNFFLPSPWLVRTWRAERRLRYKSLKSQERQNWPRNKEITYCGGCSREQQGHKEAGVSMELIFGNSGYTLTSAPLAVWTSPFVSLGLDYPTCSVIHKGNFSSDIWWSFKEWVETKYSVVFPKVLNQSENRRESGMRRQEVFTYFSCICVLWDMCLHQTGKNFITRKERSLAPAQCFWGSFWGLHDLGDCFIPRDEHSRTPWPWSRPGYVHHPPTPQNLLLCLGPNLNQEHAQVRSVITASKKS